MGPVCTLIPGPDPTLIDIFQVKSPAESAYPWDYYKLLATTPADEAWEPLAESQCALLQTARVGAQPEK